jgi:hypothetical protein
MPIIINSLVKRKMLKVFSGFPVTLVDQAVRIRVAEIGRSGHKVTEWMRMTEESHSATPGHFAGLNSMRQGRSERGAIHAE